MVTWGLALIAASCAKKSDSVLTECVLPQDQSATLEGTWNAKPAVQVAFYQGDWSSGEMAQIIGAAEIWNAHFSSARGFAAIDYGGATSPRISSVPRTTSAQLCQQTIVSNGGFIAPVVLYKVKTNWPYSPSSGNVIALTSWCPTPGKNINLIYNAMMEFNYQQFWGTNFKQPDLTTIALHEFGHMMGVNHSCDSKTNFPACATAPAEYTAAVMTPVVQFDGSTGKGDVRTELNTNDQGRANCLFGGLPGS